MSWLRRANPWGSCRECSFSPACLAVVPTLGFPSYLCCIFLCLLLARAPEHCLYKGVCPGEAVWNGGTGLRLSGMQVTQALPETTLLAVYLEAPCRSLQCGIGSGFQGGPRLISALGPLIYVWLLGVAFLVPMHDPLHCQCGESTVIAHSKGGRSCWSVLER